MKSLVMFTALLLLVGVSTNAQVKVPTPRFSQPPSISVIYHKYSDGDAPTPTSAAVSTDIELNPTPKLCRLLNVMIIDPSNPPEFTKINTASTARLSIGFKISF